MSRSDVADAAYRSLLRARTTLLLKHPFFATLALRLPLKEDRSCHSAWTDGSCFAYNPEYINALSQEKLVGLTAHLVMHPACRHHLRRGDRDFKRWNEACDHAINWILEDAGFTLPDALKPRRDFLEMSAESIYLALAGEEGEESTQEEEPDAAESSTESEEQEEQEQEENDSGDSEDENGLPGEVRDSPSLELEAEQDGEELLWEEALLSAASQARDMGKLPDGIARLVEDRLYPQLPWAELLARFIERNARTDYTWMMPNRRYLHQGLYFPSLLASELQQIVVAVDTSGSIEQEELNQFAAEISAIMEQFPSRLHLLYCDAAIQGYQQFERADLPISINPKGGGGTDFRPVFSKVTEEGIDVTCLIYLTDMECLQYPSEAPSYPVLWVQTGGKRVTPPFGELVRMMPE